MSYRNTGFFDPTSPTPPLQIPVPRGQNFRIAFPCFYAGMGFQHFHLDPHEPHHHGEYHWHETPDCVYGYSGHHPHPDIHPVPINFVEEGYTRVRVDMFDELPDGAAVSTFVSDEDQTTVVLDVYFPPLGDDDQEYRAEDVFHFALYVGKNSSGFIQEQALEVPSFSTTSWQLVVAGILDPFGQEPLEYANVTSTATGSVG